MPRAQLNKNYFTFVKGLLTEASPLTFPEGTSFDEDNFDLFVDGSRQPRRGLDFESGFSESGNISATQFTDRAHSWFLWRAVANDGANNVHVIQQGDTIELIDADTDVTSTTSLATITPTVRPLGTNVGDERLEFAFGAGFLFGAGKSIEPFQVEETSPGTFAKSDITIEIRDFEGLVDSLAIDARPGTLSDAHNYNLLNQSWFSSQITTYFGATGVFPSNADIWWEGKDSVDVFTPSLMDLQWFGNSRAPRGHFIHNAFDLDYDAAVGGGSALVNKVENGRPASVAFYAGRPFWGGPGGNVYFSQIIEGEVNIGLCYQEADPTSEHISDLVATDGGRIFIQEADDIIALRPLGASLVVLAANGVWEITGGDRGFRSDEFFVRKISNAGALGAGSALATQQALFYWSTDGIYAVTENQATGFLQATNLSEQSIQTFYRGEMNEDAKRFATGVYDDVQRKVFWFFNSDPNFDPATDPKYDYDRVLTFDLALSAFAPYTIATLDVQDPQVVLPMLRLDSLNDQKLKILTAWDIDGGTNYHFTFSEFINDEIVDWETLNGTGAPYVAFLETGYEILDDAMRDKEAVYIFTYFERTEQNVLVNPVVDQLVTNGTFDDLLSLLPKVPDDWTDIGTSVLNTALVTATTPGVVTLNRADSVGFAGIEQNITTTSPTLLHTLRITNGPTATESAEVRIGTASGLDDVLAATAVVAGTNPTLTFTPGVGNTSLFIQVRNNGPGANAFVDNISIFDPGGDSDIILFDRPSGCTMTAKWDWSDSIESGKEGNQHRVYKFERIFPLAQGDVFDPGFSVVKSKTRPRGTGRALQLRFENEPGKDCHIYGWAVAYMGATVP